ncbi:hypothetical protein [Leptospira wolffii]|uniref:hypothetical protein n=1 Tax=Leptospira wolffii TaxID=409998 RepID=UPI0003048F96|nr:hypothetical protein [Leptospira wolffii]EPG64676.1 hypothetical protein LEP1GSC061_3339 [Leptospira wolffii serovar Khorat str. Khorat-H2]
MKQPILAFILLFSMSAFSSGIDSDVRESLLKKINVIEADPLSPGAKEACRYILAFTYESKDVQVIVSQKLLPWFTRDLEYKEFLFGSFVAGNIKPQLLSGRKKDDSYSGALAMIRTYERIRGVNDSFVLEEVDRLILMEKEGRLRGYVSSVAR